MIRGLIQITGTTNHDRSNPYPPVSDSSADANNTKLYAVGQRAYSPTLQRWMQEDPLGYVDGASLYEYVRSNPHRSHDPMGLSAGTMYPDVDGPTGTNSDWVMTGVSVVTIYEKNPGVDIFFIFGSHTFVMVDGVGYGFYPATGASPWDLFFGAPGVGKSGDEGTLKIAIQAKQQEYEANERCDPGAAKRFHDAVLAMVKANMGKGPMYRAIDYNCIWWAQMIIQMAAKAAKAQVRVNDRQTH
jgi:RHS repeat-associated protein